MTVVRRDSSRTNVTLNIATSQACDLIALVVPSLFELPLAFIAYSN